MAHPEQPVRLDRQDLALVLVFLALVHALPDDRISLLPVGLTSEPNMYLLICSGSVSADHTRLGEALMSVSTVAT